MWSSTTVLLLLPAHPSSLLPSPSRGPDLASVAVLSSLQGGHHRPLNLQGTCNKPAMSPQTKHDFTFIVWIARDTSDITIFSLSSNIDSELPWGLDGTPAPAPAPEDDLGTFMIPTETDEDTGEVSALSAATQQVTPRLESSTPCGCAYGWPWKCNRACQLVRTHCRKGCRFSLSYILYDNVSYGYCYNRKYNAGSECQRGDYTLRFNQYSSYHRAKSNSYWYIKWRGGN